MEQRQNKDERSKREREREREKVRERERGEKKGRKNLTARSNESKSGAKDDIISLRLLF